MQSMAIETMEASIVQFENFQKKKTKNFCTNEPNTQFALK